MAEIWMKIHFVSDSSCNIVNLSLKIFHKGMTNNDRFTFSVGDTIRVVYVLDTKCIFSVVLGKNPFFFQLSA